MDLRTIAKSTLLASTLLLVACGGGPGAPGSQGGGTPPSTPAGLTATAGNQQVSLAWNTSTGATSYRVKRATASGGPYNTIASPTGLSFNDTMLSNGTTYFYVVSAVNAAGESANSPEKSATPALPIPSTPTGLSATPGDTQINLAWNASASATSYHVKRSTTSGGPYTQIASPAATSFINTGLTNGTTYFYVVSAVNAAGESANSSQVSATPAVAAADVTITVDPAQTKPISPWIYGINFYHNIANVPPDLTLDRSGGNRWTAYNWENNASNAGSDYFYQNDNYLINSNTPAEAVRTIIDADRNAGLASLFTVQLQGLVSADKSGPVSTTNPPDLSRFKTAVPKKSLLSATPFTTTPPTSDANVYMDEFVWALDQKFPGADIFGANPTHPAFISLDNEPELWNSTHLEVQGPNLISSDSYITKTTNLTKALKDQFPNVLIFGPVHYGFLGIYNWQAEPGLNATPTGANWFADKYLLAMKNASTTYGKRLVDVYDFHWYSEARDAASNTRVTDLTGASLTSGQVQAIVQSPRSLWDTTYKENSWIANDVLSSPIYILGRLQAKINAGWPGTKIAITEYENGGDNHIAGTIAQADNLGIFGAQGVFAATLWPLADTPYIVAGFRAFRGFDGGSANFGDVSLKTTSSDVSKVAVYASQDSTMPGRVVFVAINRSTTSQITQINGLAVSGTATLYQMTAASAASQNPVQPVLAGTMPASGTSLKITLPALSVTTIEIE